MLDANGALHLRRDDLEIVNEPPVAYQEVGGKRVSITARYLVTPDKRVEFDTYQPPPSVFIAGGGLYAAIGTTSADFPVRRAVSQGGYNGAVDHGGNEGVIARLGLCNHINALPAASAMREGTSPGLGAAASIHDQRVYNIDFASDERARLINTQAASAVDSKALAFIASVEARSSPFSMTTAVKQHVSVEWDRSFGTVASLSFNPPLIFEAQTGEDSASRAKRFIASHPELFHLSDVMLESILPEEVRHEDYGDLVRFEQRSETVPFFGTIGITVTLSQVGEIQAVSAHYYPGVLPAKPAFTLTVAQAFAAMRQDLPNLWKTADGSPSPHYDASQTTTFAPEVRPAQGDDWRHPVTTRTRIEHVGSDFTDTLDAQLVFYLIGTDLHVGWHFFRSLDNAPSYYFDIVIDATTGETLFAHTDIVRPAFLADDDLGRRLPASGLYIRQHEAATNTKSKKTPPRISDNARVPFSSASSVWSCSCAVTSANALPNPFGHASLTLLNAIDVAGAKRSF